MRVTNSRTGFTRTYRNPLGAAFQPIADTNAFGGCAAASPENAASEVSASTDPG